MRVRMQQVAILSLIFLAATGSAFAADTAMRIRIGEKAPEFRLPDLLTGKTVSLSEFKGRKVVMIDFWATWCEICVSEAPELGRLYAAWKEKGFELLSVAVPPEMPTRSVGSSGKTSSRTRPFSMRTFMWPRNCTV